MGNNSRSISSRKAQLGDTVLRKILLGQSTDDQIRLRRALTHLNTDAIRTDPCYGPLRMMAEYVLDIKPYSPSSSPHYVSPPKEKK